MSFAFALASGLSLAFLPGCRRPQAPSETVLAKVGEAEITASDFTRHLRERGERNPVPVDPQALLDELVDREVLVQNAEKSGLRDDPEVRELMRDVLIAKLKERHLSPQLEAAAVSEEELTAFYEKEKPRLMKPERVRLAMLFVSGDTKDQAASLDARQRLEAALDLARAGTGGEAAGRGFGSIAANHSEDQESRYRGGEIGWVERDRYPARLGPAVIEAGFRLKNPGQTSDIITTKDGFYVVKLLERQEAAPVPLEQAQAALRRRLLDEKQEKILTAFQSNLRKGLRIEVHPERLEGLQAAAPQATPPSPSIP